MYRKMNSLIVISLLGLCNSGGAEAVAQEPVVAKEPKTSLADSISIDIENLPEPGGYMPGLTKPLMVSISVHFWGPGITTPAPGGVFEYHRGAVFKPNAKVKKNDADKLNLPRNKPSHFETTKLVWSDTTGSFQLEAVFAGLKGDYVELIKVDGTRIKVAIEKLSRKSLQQAIKAFQDSK